MSQIGKKILITGVAGFIGFHLANRLIGQSYSVIGIDNLNDYYDISLKKSRLEILQKANEFKFHKIDLLDQQALNKLFEENKFEYVVNLAAQAGVRYSMTHPYSYIDSNIVGFMNILEACKKYPVKHLLYASSSSVYGGNKVAPFSTSHQVDHPVSLYAATKKANELMAHTYSHLYNIPTTGLRFFTVYGPWGRPDMAYFSFTKNILEGKPIDIYNYGKMKRDFTYIDDIIDAIEKLLDVIPYKNDNWDERKDSISSSFAPYKVYNIGNNEPIELEKLINTLEYFLGVEAKKNYLKMQPGDVIMTYADIDDLSASIGFKSKIHIEEGIERFIAWYTGFYMKNE